MDEEYESLVSHGNLVSIIHCRQKLMFTKKDFSTLLDSESIEDICVKLQKQYPEVLEMKRFTRCELKRKLDESLLKEIVQGMREPSAQEQISFFIESYKIQNFFFLLSSKEYDSDLESSFQKIEPLGYFNELDTLKFCVDMDEVYLYCVKNTFLSNYCEPEMFAKSLGDNDFSVLSTEVRKRHIEKYAKTTKTSFLKLLKLEGDKHNLDIVLSTLETDVDRHQKLRWMTNVTSFPQPVCEALARVTEAEELQMALGRVRGYRTLYQELRDSDLETAFLRREIDAYLSAFEIFNDVTSLYAYLKLKEQEIRNILWVAECVVSGKRDILDEMLAPAS